jgi:hypothetical protein
LLPWDGTFDIGSKTGKPPNDQDCQVPFVFTGKIDKLTISVEPPVLTDDDKKKLLEAYHAAQDAEMLAARLAPPMSSRIAYADSYAMRAEDGLQQDYGPRCIRDAIGDRVTSPEPLLAFLRRRVADA